MLKKASNFVLVSKKSSMGTLPPHISAARISHIQRRWMVAFHFRRTVRPGGYDSGFFSPAASLGKERVLARCGWAGEISGPF
jgi:hypothetical protein